MSAEMSITAAVKSLNHRPAGWKIKVDWSIRRQSWLSINFSRNARGPVDHLNQIAIACTHASIARGLECWSQGRRRRIDSIRFGSQDCVTTWRCGQGTEGSSSWPCLSLACFS